MAAADDYCNMDAVTNGAVSGRLSEWPVLRSECRRAIGEIDTLRAALAAERAKVERLEAEVKRLREVVGRAYDAETIDSVREVIRLAKPTGPDVGEQQTLRIEGKMFVCHCGCNVFTKIPEEKYVGRWRCNTCKLEYLADKVGVVDPAAARAPAGERKEDGDA